MFHRGWFSLRFLCISLILSGPTAHAGDWTLSILKETGKWAVKNIGNVAKGLATGAAIKYSADNFDPNTGTFNFGEGLTDMAGMKQALNDRAMTGGVMDNRGVPTGLQSSSTTMPTTYAAEQRAADRMTDAQRTSFFVSHTTQKAAGMSMKELNKEIMEHEQFLQGDQKDKARHKNRDKSYDTYAEQKAGELAALKAENAARKPRTETFPHTMSDEDLDKNIRNFTEKLEDAKQVYAEASKPEWWGKKNDARVEKGQVDTITNMLERFKGEKEARVKAKTIHTVSTAMVMTSKTAGTDNKTTQMERAPEGGNGGGAPDPQKPDKDPKKIIGRGIGMTAVGEGAKEVAEEAIKNMGKKPHGETHSNPHGETHSTTSTKHDKSMQEYKNHEQKVYEDAQKALKEARKAEGRAMNNDPQPFHEKGLEPIFPQKPGQKIHQIEDRRGHFKEFTPAVEEAVRSTIKKEHFDYVENGNSRYTQEVKGIQVWVEVRPDGTIKNFGGNETFHIKDPTTGRYTRPPEAMNDKGVILGLGVGAGLAAASETKASEPASDFKLSNATLEKLGIKTEVLDRIKTDSNPLKLPDAPKDNFINSVSVSPEMKAYTEHRLAHLKTLTPQQQMTEIMKPANPLPGISIPGVTTTQPTFKAPTLTLPSSTTTSSKSGQTALPVLTSTTSSTKSVPSVSQTIAQYKHASGSSSKPASLPSYSAPKSSSSSSSSGYRPSTTPSFSGSKGGSSYTFGSGQGWKKN